MKETYEAPRLVEHGTIEELTNAAGISSAQDALIIAGQPYGGYTDGSSDIRL